jgi:peptide/nickel transport system ATP-binding protein
MPQIIQAHNLKAYYAIRSYLNVETYIHAIDDINLYINDSEILGIAGESGCGKSTLIKVLLGLIPSNLKILDGKVIYNLEKNSFDLFSLDKETLRKMRWKIFSYIPQGSMNVLNPTMRIRNHFFEIIRAHQSNIEKEEIGILIEKHIKELGLPSEVLASYPHQLSGGMRQRVVIALATILKPSIIFADEPITALDVITQRGVMQMLSEVQKKMRNSIVLVTHDMGVHAEIANRLIVLYAGKIVETGLTEDIFDKPAHPYTQYLLKSLPQIGDKTKKIGIGGLPPSLSNPPRGCRFHPRCPFVAAICKEKDPEIIKVNSEHYASCHFIR